MGKRLAGLAVAACVLVGGLAFAPAADAAPVPVTGGTLDWGVKASFRNYIKNGPAAGTITTSGGATQNSGNGTFVFPGVANGSYDEATGETSGQFTGSVFFSGHGGQLEMDISDIRVSIGNGPTDLLIADVVSKTFPGGVTTQYPDVEFAELDLSSVTPTPGTNSVTFTNVPATLTDDGSPAFAGFYPSGTVLDPLTFTLNLEPPVTNDFTWKVSQQAWTSSSLQPSHGTTPPATKDAANGFVFPASTDGAFNPATREVNVQYSGALQLGNVVQGGYKIVFADPQITVDANGAGKVIADVSYCTGAAGSAPCGTLPWPLTSNVTLTTFTLTAGDITDDGSHVEFTVTPHWATVGNQFNQQLIDILNPTSPSLGGHFRATGGASDANKPPAPITVKFDYNELATPVLSATPNTNVVSGSTITVDGSDYAPNQGVYALFCTQPTGALGTPAGRPSIATQCDAANQVWLSDIGGDGAFSTPLTVDHDFGAVNCRLTQCGVFTRRDHNGGAVDYSQDQFTPVSFAPINTVPTLRAGSVSIIEGDTTKGGKTQAKVTVTLSEPLTSNLSFNWTAAGGNATSGVDYKAPTAPQQKKKIAKGKTSIVLTIDINSDTVAEGDENFVIALSNATGVNLVNGGVTIVDDEAQNDNALSVSDVTVNESDSGALIAYVTVSRPGPGTVAGKYTISTVAGSAEAGDFTPLTKTVNLPKASRSKTFAIALANDADLENETVNVVLSGVTGVPVQDGTGVITIVDDDL